MRRGFSINFFGCIMRMLSKFMERAYLCLTSAYVIGTYAYSTVTRTKAAMSNRFSLGPTANNFPQFSFSYCLFFFFIIEFYILNYQVRKNGSKFTVQKERKIMTTREALIKISCQHCTLRYCKAEHDSTMFPHRPPTPR